MEPASDWRLRRIVRALTGVILAGIVLIALFIITRREPLGAIGALLIAAAVPVLGRILVVPRDD